MMIYRWPQKYFIMLLEEFLMKSKTPFHTPPQPFTTRNTPLAAAFKVLLNLMGAGRAILNCCCHCLTIACHIERASKTQRLSNNKNMGVVPIDLGLTNFSTTVKRTFYCAPTLLQTCTQTIALHCATNERRSEWNKVKCNEDGVRMVAVCARRPGNEGHAKFCGFPVAEKVFSMLFLSLLGVTMRYCVVAGSSSAANSTLLLPLKPTTPPLSLYNIILLFISLSAFYGCMSRRSRSFLATYSQRYIYAFYSYERACVRLGACFGCNFRFRPLQCSAALRFLNEFQVFLFSTIWPRSKLVSNYILLEKSTKALSL